MAKKSKPIFWLSGNYRQVNRAWDSIVQKLGGDVNIQVMHCGYNPEDMNDSLIQFATGRDIITHLKGRDMFDDRPRIIKMLGLPEDYSMITDYLGRTNDQNLLVVCGKPGYRPHSGTKWVPAQASKFYKRFKTEGHVFGFLYEAKTVEDAKEWVKDVIKEEGSAIKDDAIKRLVELKGRDLDTLTSECIRLSIFKPKGKLKVVDIEASCSYSFLDTVWQFIDALDKRDIDSAFRFLQGFYSTAGLHTGDTFSGELIKLIAAVQQHFLFVLLLKSTKGASASTTAAHQAVSGFKKIKPSDAFKLSKGIIQAEDLPDSFSSGFIFMNLKKQGVKKALQWKLGKIFDTLRDLVRITYLCRLHYSSYSNAYQQLCLDTFALVVCGKITSQQAANARRDERYIDCITH